MKKDNTHLQRILDQLDSSNPDLSAAALQDLRAADPPRFAEGFAAEVIARIENATGAKNLHQVLPRMFRWVAIGGIAAAIVLLVLTYYQQDSLSLDAFTGISDLSISDDISL